MPWIWERMARETNGQLVPQLNDRMLRLTHELRRLDSFQHGEHVHNVKHPRYGAVGDGLRDDTAAIQRAIDASISGDTIFFPAPASSYLVEGLTLKGGRRYLFAGAFNAPVTIKLADSSNPVAVMASETFVNDENTAGSPIIIEGGLRINGNKANNTSGHGLLLANFRCRLQDVQVRDCAERGIYFSQATADTSAMTGTAIENVLHRCTVIGCDEYAIRFEDSTAFFTDGWLVDCATDDVVDEDHVRIDHATGWVIAGNHVYGDVPKYAMQIRNCDHTKIVGNYIERYGGHATATGSYEAIFAHCFENVLIANNHIKNNNDVAGSTYNAIRVTTAGAVTAYANVCGNQHEGNTNDESFLIATTTGGGTMNAFMHGNQAYKISGTYSTGANTTLIQGVNDIEGDTYRLDLIGDALFEGDVTVEGDVELEAQLGVGLAPIGRAQAYIGGPFTSDGSGTAATALRVGTQITAAAGDTGDHELLGVGGQHSGSITTQGQNETIGIVATAFVSEPNITVGTGDTVTTAATVYIKDAPTEGTNNYALFVDAGKTRLDDGIALGGGAAATLGTIGSTGPSTAGQAQWLRINIGGTDHFIPAWT